MRPVGDVNGTVLVKYQPVDNSGETNSAKLVQILDQESGQSNDMSSEPAFLQFELSLRRLRRIGDPGDEHASQQTKSEKLGTASFAAHITCMIFQYRLTVWSMQKLLVVQIDPKTTQIIFRKRSRHLFAERKTKLQGL